MDFPTLKTQRLLLEPFSQTHSLGVFALWSSPEVCRYSGDAEDWDGRPVPLPARDRSDSDKILDFFPSRMIEAYIDEENASSQRLAEHLGFEAMGASRDGAIRYERIHAPRNSRD